ncbi:MAG: transcriptional repressor LexA [Lactobacillus sp.]|nr:transcriptional repressor LexA [Lactobacillus sp.]
MAKKNKALDVLGYIYESVEAHGYPPTVREICEAVGLSSTSTVHSHICHLQDEGYLYKDATKPRALEVTNAGKRLLGIKPHAIPILGNVTAGLPIEAIENIESYFPVPPEYKQDSDLLFMLNVHGESMINAGILDGDKVIVKKQTNASNGEIVVAKNEDGEVTVKRFYQEDGHFRLQPENDTMAPIILDQVEIVGKVVGLYRDNIL